MSADDDFATRCEAKERQVTDAARHATFTSGRPLPPPFRPNKELIGYIEEGQKPPLRCGDAPSPADMDDFAGCLRAKAVELPRLRGMLVALAERVEGTADAVRREAA